MWIFVRHHTRFDTASAYSKNKLVLTDRFANTSFLLDIVKDTSRAVTDENIQQPRGVCVGPYDTVLVCSEAKTLSYTCLWKVTY
ncbi:hypothetical protein DPMN_144327 [Dreissena polymorpha]|uniref:Uncharacterized protein n=1 Tax=Dreissena polymorpha TaxID=45954 RepID=A0A9D4JKJ8_DREPO|nr:hypothetical protein DPMN_144327 [Dreissena polymorpha]